MGSRGPREILDRKGEGKKKKRGATEKRKARLKGSTQKKKHEELCVFDTTGPNFHEKRVF